MCQINSKKKKKKKAQNTSLHLISEFITSYNCHPTSCESNIQKININKQIIYEQSSRHGESNIFKWKFWEKNKILAL